jgi:hypothetical protein
MHKSAFINPLTTEQAYNLIINNHSNNYIWYPVKTTCDNIIELGGNDKELKTYIIKLDENCNIISHENEFVAISFSISLDDINFCRIDMKDATTQSTKFKSKQQLLDWLNTTPNINLIQPKLIPIYTTKLSHYNCSI